MTSLGQTAASVRSRGAQGGAAAVAAATAQDGYSNSPGQDEARHGHAFAPSRASSLPYGSGKLSKTQDHNRHSHAGHPLGMTGGVTRVEVRLLIIVTAIAFFVRTYKIGQPSSVVFDEVHFGGFASRYIKQKFFMDVHPPLAKMLIALVAWSSGFNGNFDFKEIGKEYLVGENTPVPYVAMRTFCAIMGVGTVPLAYLTLRALSLRATTALVGAMLVTFENALITQSRFILLDSPLVFFTALTTYAWVSFCNEEKRRPFSEAWWAWLSLVGISLGCVVSVKWVGLFSIATIGLCVIAQLWHHLGDVRLPLRTLARHFFARAACLILLPFVVYVSFFAIHLAVLDRSGEGDAFMSSGFQHTLRGHAMRDTYADVSLGSTVTIRHLNTQGGYLHSHPQNYPTGSGQQQVTLYPHRDENNEWFIVKAPSPNDPPPPTDEKGVPLPVAGPHEAERHWSGPLTYLEHGMEVRIVHRKTDKRLHSHDVRPPVTEADYQNEASCYGFVDEEGKRFAGDSNDHWVVEIERGDSSDAVSSKRVRSLRSIVRFRHSLTGSYLYSHKIPLPDWGFGQQEVTSNRAAGASRANK